MKNIERKQKARDEGFVTMGKEYGLILFMYI
jgi:hypothetical protein